MSVLSQASLSWNFTEVISDFFRSEYVGADDYHHMGLQIIMMMSSSVDSALLLESMCNATATLLRLQAENVTADSAKIIVDEPSLLRNYILV